MWSYSIIFGAFIELIKLKAAKTDIPGCHFLETVNISSSQGLQNGSYIYLDLEIPVNLIGQYDYITTEEEVKQLVRSHLRGCVCHLKPCIWICCRFKDWDASKNKCIDGLMEELSEINPILKVTLSNGSVVNMNLLKDFIVLRDRMQFEDIWREEKYKLFENGSVLLNGFNSMYFRGYDCLHPNQFTLGQSESVVVAVHTTIYNEEWQFKPGAIELICLSMVFLVLTIAVYLYVRKLRNLHGKFFICYMITSIIGLIHILLFDVQIDSELCVLHGYFWFFSYIAKFNWLFFMNYQLWRGFTSVNRAEAEHSFGAYSILAWGTAAILTGVIFLIDLIWDDDPSKFDWVSGVGWENCYIRITDDMFGFVFFAVPIVTAIVLNTILFILTTISIIRIRLAMRHFSDQVESARNLKSKMETYNVILRLFILMDLQWSVRLIYWFVDWELFRDICAYWNISTGLIIFVLFVLKRSTLKLLIDKLRKRRK